MIPPIRKRVLKRAEQHLFFYNLRSGHSCPQRAYRLYAARETRTEIRSEQKQYDNITLAWDCSLNSIPLHYIPLSSFLAEKFSYTVLGFLLFSLVVPPSYIVREHDFTNVCQRRLQQFSWHVITYKNAVTEPWQGTGEPQVANRSYLPTCSCHSTADRQRVYQRLLARPTIEHLLTCLL